MKEIKMSSVIEGCNAKNYFDFLYKDDTAMRRFHEVANDDTAVVISQWQEGTRVVEFNMPVKVSGTLKAMIGVSSVPVKETQVVEWASPQEFKLKSVPEMGFPGATKFTTSVVTTVVELGHNTVQVTTCLMCTASLPWPLQSQVEGIMAEQAKDSIQVFLNFCADWVANALAAAPSKPTATTVAPIALSIDADATVAAAAAPPQPEAVGRPEPEAAAVAAAGAAAESAEPSTSALPAAAAPAAPAPPLRADSRQSVVEEEFFDVAEGLSAEDVALFREATRLQMEQLSCLRGMEAASLGTYRLLEKLLQFVETPSSSAPGLHPLATPRVAVVEQPGNSKALAAPAALSWLLPMAMGASIGCAVTYYVMRPRPH